MSDLLRGETLHSILVKSIPCIQGFRIVNNDLYIPFWLNLYAASYSSGIQFEHLYIPFWLNLYSPVLLRVPQPPHTLHSILVKSIHFFSAFSQFHSLTLHSILVKSIHSRKSPSTYSISFTFHSG